LSDGETGGYWLLFLATPYHGRAIPCHFVSYSSKTINQEATSRNRQHFEAFEEVKKLLGDRPLVLDREFSYLELMENMTKEDVNFVIHLKEGATFCDSEGKPVTLSIAKGETRILNKVFYRGKVFVNVIGIWKEGIAKPLWVMTNLKAEDGLAIHLQRMKIEECFRDMKNILGLEKLMNKRRKYMEKMVALLVIAYAIGLWLGETLREAVFPGDHPKHNTYSGLFVLLKLKLTISAQDYTRISSQTLKSFALLALDVRTNV
jgi:Transposase DDE domain